MCCALSAQWIFTAHSVYAVSKLCVCSESEENQSGEGEDGGQKGTEGGNEEIQDQEGPSASDEEVTLEKTVDNISD